MRPATALLALLALLPCLATPSARAAESYDNCAGFIDSLPAVLTEQGTWCLRADLSTAITSGVAIEIATNNVTLDCNDFKLGGLAAGVDTGTVGILATARLNGTVRNCNVRGFLVGLQLDGGGGHVVEDNRFESNRLRGIALAGDGNIVRRNLLVDTGGSAAATYTAALFSTGGQLLVQDNVVNGVTTPNLVQVASGIFLQDSANSLVQGNHLSGLVGTAETAMVGLVAVGSNNALFRENNVAISSPGTTYGIVCELEFCRCRDNVLLGTTSGATGCGDLGGNSHVAP